MDLIDHHNGNLSRAVEDLLNASFHADLHVWHNATDAGLMRAIHAAETAERPAYVGALAVNLGLPMPTVQRHVVLLVERGYLRKRRVLRRHLLYVTESGHEKLAAHAAEINRYVASLLDAGADQAADADAADVALDGHQDGAPG